VSGGSLPRAIARSRRRPGRRAARDAAAAPQGLRDRLLMSAVGLKREAFAERDGAARPAAAART
jgi:hypothetical protein